MTTKDLETKAREIRELKRLRDDVDAEITALEDEIKAHMTANNAECLTVGEYKITWKNVTSSRLDTAALRQSMPELVKLYTRPTTTRRFVVN